MAGRVAPPSSSSPGRPIGGSNHSWTCRLNQGRFLLLPQVGSLVYARVSLANRDMEPELECFDATTRKSEGFEELKGGMVVSCSLRMARR